MITQIRYNWHMVGDSETGATTGDDYEIDTIGEKNRHTGEIVKTIIEYRSKGEEGKLFYDIELEDGSSIRVFNPNMVFASKD